MENLITIKLFGQTYTFKTASDIEKANAIGDLLVQEVNRIQNQSIGRQSPEMTNTTILILAALNLANENYDLKMKHSEFLSRIADRSKNLLNRIDRNMNQEV